MAREKLLARNSHPPRQPRRSPLSEGPRLWYSSSQLCKTNFGPETQHVAYPVLNGPLAASAHGGIIAASAKYLPTWHVLWRPPPANGVTVRVRQTRVLRPRTPSMAPRAAEDTIRSRAPRDACRYRSKASCLNEVRRPWHGTEAGRHPPGLYPRAKETTDNGQTRTPTRTSAYGVLVPREGRGGPQIRRPPGTLGPLSG